ncbi:hypothetical protein [Nostoc sp.]
MNQYSSHWQEQQQVLNRQLQRINRPTAGATEEEAREAIAGLS